MKDNNRDVAPPLAYRLVRFFGYPFGLRWVPDNHLGVIFRMEMYHKLKGPGFFWITPLVESVKRRIRISPDFLSTPIRGLHTRDGVDLGLKVALAYAFDPRPLSRADAVVLTALPSSELRAIVTDSATWTLLNIMPQYYAEQICRGAAFETIRQRLISQLNELLRPLGMRPAFVMILEVIVPESLQDTFTAVVNRAAYTHDLSLYHPFELSEVRRRELYEVLTKIPGGIRYLDLAGADLGVPSWQTAMPAPQETLLRAARSVISPSPEPSVDDTSPKLSGVSAPNQLPPPTTQSSIETDTRDEQPESRGISRKSHLAGRQWYD